MGKNAVLMRELERVYCSFPLHLPVLFLFFFYSFYPAPEPSQHSSGVSAPFRPLCLLPSPCLHMHCRGKCFPAVHAACSIYHNASLCSLGSAAQSQHEARANLPATVSPALDGIVLLHHSTDQPGNHDCVAGGVSVIFFDIATFLVLLIDLTSPPGTP